MQATIDRKQLNDLIDNLKTIGDEVANAVFNEIEATALEIESDAKIRCPKKTSNLASSIKAISDRKTFSAGVFTPVEYAPDVEFGTRPHIIKAVNAKSLAFKVNNEMVFRQSVMHPGTQAQPFLYPAYFAGIGRLMRNLENVMKNVKGDK